MTFERLSPGSAVELKAGSAHVGIDDFSNLLDTIYTANERTQLAGRWFDDNEHRHLLESAVVLERIDDSERVLFGQVLIDPLTRFDQPDATLVTMYSYLMMVLDYNNIPSTFEMDTDERWVIAMGDTSSEATFIRIEAMPYNTELNTRAAHHITLSMRLTNGADQSTREKQVIDFFKLWAATHDFVHHQTMPTPPDSEAIMLSVPSSRMEDNELRIWQILSDFEASQQDDTKRRYSVDMGGIDIGAVTVAAHGLDAPTIHKALTRVVITKVVELSLTGGAEAMTTTEIITTLNRIRDSQ